MDKVRGLNDGIHQRHVIQGLLVITILIDVVAIFFHADRQLWQMVIINLVMLGYCLAFLACLRQTAHLHRWALGYVLLFVTVTLDAFYLTRFQTGGGVWIILFPLTSYLLLGKRTGALVTALSVTAGLGLFLWIDNSDYHYGSLANLTGSAAVSWALSHLYETRRVRTIDQLQHDAWHDPLTGLYNRRHLAQAFDRACDIHDASGSGFALLVMDIDHFKRINDRHGHDVGDQVLVTTASRIQEHLFDNDRAFRIGGEEFCLLLFDTHALNARQIAEAIRAHQASPCIMTGKGPLESTLSIGIAMWPDDGRALDDILRTADMRMYDAKQAGRNRVVDASGPALTSTYPSPVARGASRGGAAT
ncbi:GGDEF domain-containing protein [Larsenimonas rhizosphaerae]|uniref:diguanylate cyclase n=1 Tax=Larsenimonas rhizosphaerae TaxID=2944682 RepID=A0AA42CXY7_9GAMM|nr:GGDEF domain-containing protein [Larsenimonas rhizosphaerae]MCM2129790.1 GGDEF domain-containing protein [Larsenimonas rhizosphaerae]MCX2524453.1 GGDEF domain-containing protein [Larsenimonas rhizosphaerae]